MQVAFVPSAPFLLPALGGGPADLRAACLAALGRLEGPVTVLGAAVTAGPVTGTVDATPWGAPGPPAPDPLPLALAVGASLLGDREHRLIGVGVDLVPVGTLPLEGAVLVVADGSAKRSEKAPGAFDPRAEPFDHDVERALAAGDPQALLALDPALAGELWVGGLATWQCAARALAGRRFDADLLWAGAPYGVSYVVATWVQAD